MPDRLLAIVCDGAGGRSASLLGLSDEFQHVSCKAYGAMADIERLHVNQSSPSASPRCASPSPRSPSPSPYFPTKHTDTLQQQQFYDSANSQIRCLSVSLQTSAGFSNRRPSQGFYLFNTIQHSPYEADAECTADSFYREGAQATDVTSVKTGNGSNSSKITRPTPDRVIHGITFDLSQHGKDLATTAFDIAAAVPTSSSTALPRAFHLKIFGSLHRRYMALAVPRCESDIVRGLKACDDHGVCMTILCTGENSIYMLYFYAYMKALTGK